MAGIYWLASYPKSGNTWLRVFLTNYWRDAEEPADINALDDGPLASERELFDELIGIEASDLMRTEIERYRPLMYEQLVAETEEDTTLFLKVHDAFLTNTAGKPLFPKTVTAGVIYLIRNPLDVAASYAHHNNEPVAKTIKWMASDDHSLMGWSDHIDNQLPQRLLSWTNHVRSWIEEPGLNRLVVRYEDMYEHSHTTFAGIIRFTGAEVDEQRLHKALDFSRFERLQAQEIEHGFGIKQPTAESFFRKGVVGSWREVLSEDHVATLIATHHEVMQQFGYLTDKDEPVY